MVKFSGKINSNRAEVFVQKFIDEFYFSNYATYGNLSNLTDGQIDTLIADLQIYLQTNLGTPYGGYTITVTLEDLASENVVDDVTGDITRDINGLIFEITAS